MLHGTKHVDIYTAHPGNGSWGSIITQNVVNFIRLGDQSINHSIGLKFIYQPKSRSNHDLVQIQIEVEVNIF